MKKIYALSLAFFLITTGSSFQIITAQEKTETEKELQDAIKEQKKAINEQKKAQEESNLEKVHQDIEELKNMENDFQFDFQSDNPGDVRVYRRRGSGSVIVPTPPDAPNAPYMFSYGRHGFGGDTERTTWDFSKSVKETSFKRDYSFDVEKTAKTVVMSINGDCSAGEIAIKILTPGGKSFADIVIDEYGNLNWRKSFNISETENQDKTGEWTFKISSNKASGYFKISFQTF